MTEKQAVRRARIADAVLDLVAREGVERVTLRSVAAEARVSMGQVQHYFASRDDMILDAVRTAMAGMERRIEERVSDLGQGADAEAILRAMLEEMLGLHPGSRRLLRVSAAFLSPSFTDRRIAQALTEDDPQLLAFTADTIRAAQVDGRADASLEPDQEAVILWALAGHLGFEVALDRCPGERALVTMRYHLDRLFRPR